MRRKILVRGPALSRSGYGEHARFILRALRSREDVFDIYLQNLNWGKTGWLWEENEERAWLDHTILKSIQYIQSGGQFDASLQVTIPNEWEKLAPINIGVTAGIETTKVSPQWIEKSMLMDEIVTISEHSKNVYQDTSYQAQNAKTGEVIENFSCTTPIKVVHYPVRDYEPADLDIDFETEFNFLTVAQISPRKNMENTIKWFVEEFIDQPIGLVVKANTMNNSIIDRIHTENLIKGYLREYQNRKCKIYLLHGSMTDEEMVTLYKHPKIKAYVTLTHGEGFGLPIFEAVYNELPVVAPDWSGHVDFLYKPVKDKKTGKEKMKAHYAKVDYTLQQVSPEAAWEGVIQPDSMWCNADEVSYRRRLREVYKDYNRFKSQAKRLNKWVRSTFTAENQYKKHTDVFMEFVTNNQVESEELDGWLNSLEEEVVEFG